MKSHFSPATFKFFCLPNILIMMYKASLCFSFLEFIELLGCANQRFYSSVQPLFTLSLSHCETPISLVLVCVVESHRSLRWVFFFFFLMFFRVENFVDLSSHLLILLSASSNMPQSPSSEFFTSAIVHFNSSLVLLYNLFLLRFSIH